MPFATIQKTSENGIMRDIDVITSAGAIPHGHEVDWSEMVMDLRRRKMTYAEMALVLGATRMKVKGWQLYGHRLRFEDGLKLIALWCQKTEKAVAMIPLRVRVGVKAAR